MLTEEPDLDQQNLLWIQRITLGDRAAFEKLYKANTGKLLAIAHKLLGRRDKAEEALQDTFVKIWHNADSYHIQRGSVLTWMVSIIRNRCLDELRHQKVERKHEVNALMPADINIDASGQAELSSSKLYQCFELLKGKQRNSIQLAYFYGFTHQEIVARLEAPIGTIKSWIKRGLESLKRCVKS